MTVISAWILCTVEEARRILRVHDYGDLLFEALVQSASLEVLSCSHLQFFVFKPAFIVRRPEANPAIGTASHNLSAVKYVG
jgi:hypothetical protein